LLFYVILKITITNTTTQDDIIMFEHLLSKPKVHSAVMQMLKAFTERKIAIGERIPPLRQLAGEFDVSLYTIHNAINELKVSGYIENRGSNLNFLAKLPSLNEFVDLNGVTISTLVRDYSDMSKLNSMLIREQSNSAFKSKYPHIEIKEVQAKGDGKNFAIEQIKQLMRNGIPSTNTITQTELPIYEKFNLIAPIKEEMLTDYLGQVKSSYVKRCKVDDELYLLPTSATATCYTYNHKLFALAKVDPEYCFSGLNAFLKSLRQLRSYTGKAPLIFTHSADMYIWLQHLVTNDLQITAPGQQLLPIDWQNDYSTGALEYFYKVMFEEKLGIINDSAYEENILSLYGNEVPIVFDSGTLASFLMGHRQTDNYSLAQLGKTGLGNVAGSFIRAGADEREQLAALKYVRHYIEWVHKDVGGMCSSSYNRYSKPWTIYKNIENDKFLCKDSNFPDAWRNSVKQIEANLIWEPLGNDWEKKISGKSLQNLLTTDRKVSVDALKFYLSSINISSISGEKLTQIMALA
jgi:regulatory GntR family protein